MEFPQVGPPSGNQVVTKRIVAAFSFVLNTNLNTTPRQHNVYVFCSQAKVTIDNTIDIKIRFFIMAVDFMGLSFICLFQNVRCHLLDNVRNYFRMPDAAVPEI